MPPSHVGVGRKVVCERSEPLENSSIGHFHDDDIYYNYQNPTVFCFLMLIRAIVIKLHGDYKI